MLIATLTRDQLDMLSQACDQARRDYETFRLAYDETDRSLKFKIGGFGWSPPMPAEEI